MSTEDQNLQGGHTPLTPPPVETASVPPAPRAESAPSASPAPQRKSAGAKPIAIVTAVVGGIALLGAGGAAAFAGVNTLTRTNSEQSVGVDGIEDLELEVDASDVTVQFSDVEDAELTVTSGRGAWTLERDGDTLVVESPRALFGWWFGNWFGDEENVVLELPESLRSAAIGADIRLDAGSLELSGDFGEMDVEVGAGALEIEGSATALDAQVSAGRADVQLDGLRAADLGVSAGRLVAEFTGTAPDEIVIDVSAGSLDLIVPDAAYSVTQDVSAGSLDSRVDESDSARRTIDVSVSAGSATIRPGD